MFVFLINAGLLMVVGLQLPSIVEGLSGRSGGGRALCLT